MIKSREIDDIIKGIKGFLPFAVINSDPRNRVEKLLSYSANDIIPNSLSVMNVDGSARFTKLGIGVDPLSALTIDFDPSLQDGILIRDNRDVNRKTLINQAEGATYIYNTNVGTFGTEAIRILSDNNTYFSANVGIGTDSPSTSMTGGLHIKSTAGNSLILEKSSGAALQFRSDATTIRASIAGINGGDGLVFQTGAAQTERMRISSDGNVGIGVDSPAVRLDVRKDETVNFAPNNDQRIRAQIVARNNNETAEDFSSISLVTGSSNQAEWSINNIYKSAYNGDLSFKTRAGGGNADWRERMRINNAGYVGIGTDNPLYALDLDGGTTVDDRMRLNRGSDDTAQFMTLGWNNISVHRSNVPIASNQTSLSFNQVGSDGSRTAMKITGSGTVGIGTNNPDTNHKLDVVSDGSANVYIRTTAGSATGNALKIEGYQPNGVSAFVARLEARNRNGDVTLSQIDTETDSVYNSGALLFQTSSVGTMTEKMRITSAGNVGIGETNPIDHRLTVKEDRRGNEPAYGALHLSSIATTLEDRVGIVFNQTGVSHRARASIMATAEDAGGYAAGLSFFTRYALDGTALQTSDERMRITSAGFVGINMVEPPRQLSVLGEGNATVATIITPSTNGGNFGILDLKRQDNAVNSSIGVRFSHGNSSNVTNDIEYGFIGGGIEDPAAGSEKGFLNFAVGPARTEYMRITGDGDVSIGGNTTPLARLHVADEYSSDSDIAYFENTHSDGGAFLTIKQYETTAQPVRSAAIRLGTKGSIIWYQGILRRGGSDHFNTWSLNTTNDNNTSEAKFAVTTGGQVGIGVTSPPSLLTLKDGNILLAHSSTDVDGGHGIFFHTTTNNWSEAAAHAAIYGKRVDGSNGYLRFDTRNGGTTAESMRITNAGHVGINTTDTKNAMLYVEQDAANTAGGIQIGRQGGANAWAISNVGSNLRFGVDNTGDGTVNIDAVTFDYTGNVGIGTDLPSKALSVVGDAVFDGPTQTISSAGAGRVGAAINLDSNYQFEVGYTPDGTVSGNDYLGAVYFNTADTSGNGAGVGAAIRSVVMDPYGRYSLDFHTTGNSASEGDDALRMRINHIGRVGIGTGAPRCILNLDGNDSTAVTFGIDNTSGGGTLDISCLGSIYTAHGAAPGEVWFYSPNNINIGGATSNTNDIKFLGGGSEKARIRTSGGITFNGDTADANALDDYEEGAHIAALTPDSGSITVDSSYNAVGYQIVGGYVTVSGRIRISSVSSPSGHVVMSLPFTCDNGSGERYMGASTCFITGATANAQDFGIVLYEGNNYCHIYLMTGTTYGVAASQFSGDETITFSLKYKMA